MESICNQVADFSRMGRLDLPINPQNLSNVRGILVCGDISIS